MAPDTPKPRARTLVAAMAFVLAIGIVAALAIEIPTWEREARNLPDAKDRVAMQNEIFRTLIQLAGGAILIAGFYFTAKTIRVSQEGQITDRFNKAIDHIGSPTLAIRLGGIYALARIAADSAKDAPTIIEIFASLLRDASATDSPIVPADVKALLIILCTAPWARGTPRDLTACKFRGLNVEGLDFRNAILTDAGFIDCNMRATRFDGANLRSADFTNGYFRESSFQGADATVCRFVNASLRDADFTNAAIFGADFTDASVIGTNFSGATNAIRTQFDQAIMDERTTLPTFVTVSPAE